MSNLVMPLKNKRKVSNASSPNIAQIIADTKKAQQSTQLTTATNKAWTKHDFCQVNNSIINAWETCYIHTYMQNLFRQMLFLLQR